MHDDNNTITHYINTQNKEQYYDFHDHFHCLMTHHNLAVYMLHLCTVDILRSHGNTEIELLQKQNFI